MKNKLLLTTLLLLFMQLTFAGNPVSLQNAELVAHNIYFERSFQQQPIDYASIAIANIRTINDENGDAALYIFNIKNGGFVIVSADDALPPVIGYGLSGTCSDAGINANFDSFMETYVDEIEYIRSNNIQAEASVSEAWQKYATGAPPTLSAKSNERGVSPLLINLWNQDNPYNMYCPTDPMGPGGHVYAGCVATAMSMVMHYWRYPLQGNGSHGYSWENYGYIFANFGETEYIFNNMQESMDNEMTDIALLQFHCGVAVEMMYGNDGSGAYSWDVPGAIKQYFGYASVASFKQKDDYSNTAWADLLKGQIDAGQPMYYSGFSNSGGHAFVCDGYDDANLFHFNFGWSGSSNGFYTLYDVGGFSGGQGAVINFVPGGDYPYNYSGQQLVTGSSGSIEDGSGPVADYSADNEISWLISPQSPEDSVSSITLEFKRFDLSQDDELTIYDGATASSSLLGAYTGSDLPPVLNTSGNELLLVFKSNGDATADGFLAEYTSHAPVWCTGLTVLTESMADISDGSMGFNYDHNKMCKWMIMPTELVATTLHFSSFDTEASHDKLLIYDQSNMQLLAEYSGSFTPDNLPAPVTSPSGKFYLIFITNKSISGQGWDAWYAPETVGIDPVVEATNQMSLFPNPTANQVTLALPSTTSHRAVITVYSLDGKKVFAGETDGKLSYTFSVADFKPGIYVVIVRTGDTFYRKELAVY
ncbi:MAG: T9SS type A sorting domain-containing protein [Clostridia bacterium]|nr:T9SS type A sorting domain-containing protein [Clostridia bacterium]